VASETERWLAHHGIAHDGLYLRRTGDRRKDFVVKKEVYDRHIAGRYTVRVVFEDRDQVVRLWRTSSASPASRSPGAIFRCKGGRDRR
jgi:hypothetical protein